MPKKTHRIGRKMSQVMFLASQPGGMARIDLASKVGPHGSLKYGYEIVNRAIKAGIVRTGVATESGRKGLLVFCDL